MGMQEKSIKIVHATGCELPQTRRYFMIRALITLLFSLIIVVLPVYAGHSFQNRVSLGIKQEKTIAPFGIKIKFVDVIEDSRCPEGRVCVWAGNAKVKIQVRSDRQRPVELEVNSTIQPQVVNYGRYEIRLAALEPRPGADNGETAPKNYVATFTIRRLVK